MKPHSSPPKKKKQSDKNEKELSSKSKTSRQSKKQDKTTKPQQLPVVEGTNNDNCDSSCSSTRECSSDGSCTIVALDGNSESCSSIQNYYCNTSNNMKNFENEDVETQITETLKKMRSNLADFELQADECLELGRISFIGGKAEQRAEHQHRIAELGGIRLVVQAMQEHLYEPKVQAWGCLALANVCSDYSENDPLITIEGGIGAARDAMLAHPNDEEVQNYACMVFRNITFFSPENRSLVPLAGGIPLLLQAMTNHPTSGDLQTSAIATLANLSLNQENKEIILKKNGLALIRSAMNTNRDHMDMQKSCRVAIQRLMQENFRSSAV